METMHHNEAQEKAPQQEQLSIVEQKKQEASLFVEQRVTSLMQEENTSLLSAVHRVYEEVKGNDYRKEQATAKLLECLSLANEVGLREEEIVRVYPNLSSFVKKYSEEEAANDARYLVTQHN